MWTCVDLLHKISTKYIEVCFCKLTKNDAFCKALHTVCCLSSPNCFWSFHIDYHRNTYIMDLSSLSPHTMDLFSKDLMFPHIWSKAYILNYIHPLTIWSHLFFKFISVNVIRAWLSSRIRTKALKHLRNPAILAALREILLSPLPLQATVAFLLLSPPKSRHRTSRHVGC